MTDNATCSAPDPLTPHHRRGPSPRRGEPAPAPSIGGEAQPGATTGGGSAARATAACLSDPVQGFQKIDFDAALARRVTVMRLRLMAAIAAHAGADGWTTIPASRLCEAAGYVAETGTTQDRLKMERLGWIETCFVQRPGRPGGRPQVAMRLTDQGRALRRAMIDLLFADIEEDAA